MERRGSNGSAWAVSIMAAAVLLPGVAGAGDWTPDRFKPQFTEGEREARHVAAESRDLFEWPHLDGQWKGIVVTRGGAVYFSVGSHLKTHHAVIFRYEPGADRVEFLADVGAVLEGGSESEAPQDKIHTPLFEDGDWIYAATCDGTVYEGREYPGGHWLAIHQPSGKVHDLGRSASGDGILAMGFDPRRRILYGHTNNEGRLLRFDLKTRTESDLGYPWEGSAAEWPRGISVAVHPDGRVFGGRPPGVTFWEWDPAAERLRTLHPEMPEPEAVAQGEAGAAAAFKKSSVHAMRGSGNGCFYFVRSFDEMLGRFFPPTGEKEARVEMVGPLRPDHLERRYDDRLPSCTLVIDKGYVYYTPYTGWGGEASLVRLDLESGKLEDLGPLVVEGDRRVAEVHTMDIARDGTLYIVGFVYSIEGEDPVGEHAVRDGYPFHPRLVIVDPARLLRDAGESNSQP